jgi:hypothetical protein
VIGTIHEVNDGDTLDRRENRHGRSDDGVAEKQSRADHAHGDNPARSFGETGGGERHQRQSAAFSAVVGSRDEEDVFDGDGNRQRPDDEREQPEDLDGGLLCCGAYEERLAESVERARTDVAIDDAKGAENKDGKMFVFGVAGRVGRNVAGRCRAGCGRLRHKAFRAP